MRQYLSAVQHTLKQNNTNYGHTSTNHVRLPGLEGREIDSRLPGPDTLRNTWINVTSNNISSCPRAEFNHFNTKTAEPIVMRLGLWAWMGSRNHELDGGPDPSMGSGNFEGMGAHYKV